MKDSKILDMTLTLDTPTSKVWESKLKITSET